MDVASLISDPAKTVADEVARRFAVRDQLVATHSDGLIPPLTLRDLRVYYGGRGVWFDAQRTRALDARGITVGVLNTGMHYSDALSEDGIIYSYPHTERPAQDFAEITATKAAGTHKVPVFVVTRPDSRHRSIRLGWVTGWRDADEIFLITFDEDPPKKLSEEDHSDNEPFDLFGARTRRANRNVNTRPNQARFKFEVVQRYGSQCPLSGVTEMCMLDAAHIVPVARRGSDDPRNGLLLNAALHRAFDANLFAIDPQTLEVVLKPSGPTLGDLGITTPSVAHLRKHPHREALQWRYDQWLTRTT